GQGRGCHHVVDSDDELRDAAGSVHHRRPTRAAQPGARQLESLVDPRSVGSAAAKGDQGMATRPPRTARLSREAIVNAALTFLDREGWDALTINALANQLGT